MDVDFSHPLLAIAGGPWGTPFAGNLVSIRRIYGKRLRGSHAKPALY
jgi:hypothetical protein